MAQLTPQMQQQLPPSNPNSSQYHSVYIPSLEQAGRIVSDESEGWEDRWGAIAVDDLRAVVGVSTDAASEQMAKEGARLDCTRRGGRDCGVKISYYNQCAVLIAADVGYNTASAATIEVAKKGAVSDCRRYGRKNCRVYYSGCSLPERVY